MCPPKAGHWQFCLGRLLACSAAPFEPQGRCTSDPEQAYGYGTRRLRDSPPRPPLGTMRRVVPLRSCPLPGWANKWPPTADRGINRIVGRSMPHKRRRGDQGPDAFTHPGCAPRCVQLRHQGFVLNPHDRGFFEPPPWHPPPQPSGRATNATAHFGWLARFGGQLVAGAGCPNATAGEDTASRPKAMLWVNINGFRTT